MSELEPDGTQDNSKLPILYLLLLGASVVMLVLGWMVYSSSNDAWLLGAAGVAMIVIMALFPIAKAVTGQKDDSGSADTAKMIQLLESMNERMLISDTAKRIAFRDKDRGALRDAIRDDIQKGEFEAALVLVDEMSRSYGYREEAETFRSEILVAREAESQRKLREALSVLEEMIEQKHWAEAIREATKVQRLYPDMEAARGLARKVQTDREKHKEQLIESFRGAHQRGDASESWKMLKELDLYLTEAEAVPLREMATEVINKHRESLQEIFKDSVKSKQWQQALRVGGEIIDEFSHMKMADEVRALMPSLRESAAKQEASGGMGVPAPAPPAAPPAPAPGAAAPPMGGVPAPDASASSEPPTMGDAPSPADSPTGDSPAS
jgi:hypothetical protein